MFTNLEIVILTVLRLGVLVALVGWGQAASTVGLKGTDGEAVGQAVTRGSATTVRAGSTGSHPVLIASQTYLKFWPLRAG